jgi:hypothetical protein
MKKIYLIISLCLLTALWIGCGLVSIAIFMSQDINGSITAQSGSAPLDDSFGGVVVDLTTNDNWDKVEIDGVESMCVHMRAVNNRAEAVSGEVWVTADTNVAGVTSRTDIVNRGGFRIFHGLALNASETRIFTCSETFALLENTDLLVDVVQTGHFAVWGIGDQDRYNITYDGIVLGIHVTGSLK